MSTGETRDSLYLVDSHSLIYQVFHALPMMTSPSGLPTNALFGFTKDMIYLRRERKPSHLVCVFDVGAPTIRVKLAADYKANRAPMPDDLRLQLPLIRQMLEAMRIPVLGVPDVEADDVLATLAKKGCARGLDVLLCTSDKDCRQLIGDCVKMFNIRKETVLGRAELRADWGITPEQVVDYQTLVGDSVDNVKGVAGIGPKTASQLLQQYGTLENLLNHLDEIKGKKRENLEAARPFLPITRELVRLRTDVEVAEDWDQWRLQPWDGMRLLEMFRDWGFRGLADMVRETLREGGQPVPAAKTVRVVQGDLFGEEGNPPPSSVPALPWQATYQLINAPESFQVFLTDLKKQKRFAIDLETTSLNPLDADIVGIAICWKEGEAYYLATRGPRGEPLLNLQDAIQELKPLLESPQIEKINQNIKYDMQVLMRHGVDLNGVAGDPMVADYLLHAGQRGHNLEVMAEKHLGHRVIPITDLIGKGKQQRRMDEVPCARVAEYAGEDADVAWRLCAKLEPLLQEWNLKRPPGDEGPPESYHLYDDLEIPLIRVLAEMENVGMRLDLPLLARLSSEMGERLVTLEKDIYRLAGREFNIGSVKQLRDILFKELGYKPKGLTTITRVASTDQVALEELAKEGYELPKVLLQHRKIAKLKSTYVDALPILVHPRTGRVHASFNQTVAATGRLSSSEPNLQNIPIRSEDGEQIRQAFLPRAGWDLIAADYSQIELRLLSHFCEDENLRRAFAEDRDIHASVAAQVFGVEEAAITGNQRRMAKTINFGIIYGISPFGLAARLEIDKDEAAKFIEAYFAKYPRVLAYQENLLRDGFQNGYVQTILGRRRAIQGIRERTSYKNRNQPEREAINMQIQGSAADLIKVAMVRIAQRLRTERRQTKMLLQIHDELVFETPPEERSVILEMVRTEMTQALADRLTVPIKVDIGAGPNWLDLKEVV